MTETVTARPQPVTTSPCQQLHQIFTRQPIGTIVQNGRQASQGKIHPAATLLGTHNSWLPLPPMADNLSLLTAWLCRADVSSNTHSHTHTQTSCPLMCGGANEHREAAEGYDRGKGVTFESGRGGWVGWKVTFMAWWRADTSGPESAGIESGQRACTSPLAALWARLLVRGSVWSLFWASSQPDIIISLTQGRVISLPAPALLSWINIICDSQPLSTTEQPYLSSRQKPLAHFDWSRSLWWKLHSSDGSLWTASFTGVWTGAEINMPISGLLV